ncbi:hypothetical protein LX36DRAFT_146077 [Colletotrichum falcatum]|nr:hypothetical protein LX36DRAFT_146077 [Colletotrichum falcatum]
MDQRRDVLLACCAPFSLFMGARARARVCALCGEAFHTTGRWKLAIHAPPPPPAKMGSAWNLLDRAPRKSSRMYAVPCGVGRFSCHHWPADYSIGGEGKGVSTAVSGKGRRLHRCETRTAISRRIAKPPKLKLHVKARGGRGGTGPSDLPLWFPSGIPASISVWGREDVSVQLLATEDGRGG